MFPIVSKDGPATLKAFLDNFCAAKAQVPPIAGTIFRETMTQPGVYFWLDLPFVDIVALYSNVAENPGFISGTIPGQAQKKWLVATLKDIAKKRTTAPKALILAVHHPPFSSAGHSGSDAMLADIDDACHQAAVMPNLVLAAHSHTYQRYTRRMAFGGKALQIPFIVCGVGGFNAQTVPKASGQVTGDHSFDASHEGYGYLLLEVTKTQITVTMTGVVEKTRVKTQVEQIIVPL